MSYHGFGAVPTTEEQCILECSAEKSDSYDKCRKVPTSPDKELQRRQKCFKDADSVYFKCTNGCKSAAGAGTVIVVGTVALILMKVLG